MADAAAETFVMHGSRAILAKFGSAVHIEHQITTIEKAVFETPSLAFDLAKALVETICRTILQDRGRIYESSWELNRLFNETIQCLRLVPETHATDPEVRRSILKTLAGLNGLIQGLCELRNTGGMASHGHEHSTSLWTQCKRSLQQERRTLSFTIFFRYIELMCAIRLSEGFDTAILMNSMNLSMILMTR
jgi:hypothetical protein